MSPDISAITASVAISVGTALTPAWGRGVAIIIAITLSLFAYIYVDALSLVRRPVALSSFSVASFVGALPIIGVTLTLAVLDCKAGQRVAVGAEGMARKWHIAE